MILGKTSVQILMLLTLLLINFHNSTALTGTFIKNDGQINNEKILYYSLSETLDVFFQNDRISFVFKNLVGEDASYTEGLKNFRFDMILENIEAMPSLIPNDIADTRLNFYLPHVPDGLRDVRNYGQLTYQNLGQGLDLQFYFVDGKLQFKFNNSGKSNALSILKFDGINFISESANDLNMIEIHSDAGLFKMSFNGINFDIYPNQISLNIEPKVNYNDKLHDSMNSKEHDEFQGGDLSWITYLGGSSFDHLYCIDADENANLLLCGLTNSPDFPVTTGSYQPQKKGGEDAIILKLDKASKIDWCTFIGGSAADRAINIFKRDSVIWVSGESLSHDFPITTNAHQKYNAGGSADILMMRLDDRGYLLHATYHGGSGYDSSPDLTVDSKYNVWLIGRTFSNNFPVTSNAYYPNKGNFYDAFMISLDKNGDLRYCSFFPADQDVFGEGIAVDSNDNVCITGYTLTDKLPVTSAAYQKNKNAKYDAYLAKFTNLGKPIWITYFGGNGQDYGSNLTVDPYGNFFIFGFTNSTDLPTNSGVFQPQINGSFDSFIAKFNNDGEFQWATYFGGSGLEGVGEGILYQIGGVKSDKYGNILVSGQTRSADFPVTKDAFQNHLKGPSDSFIAKFDVNGKLLYSTLLGGSSNDRGYDVVFDNEGYLVNVGWTESTDFPVTENAFQKTYNGSVDAYIFRLKECEEFFEYELIIPNDTSALASKNIEIPFQLKIHNGPPQIDKLVVKLRFVSNYFENIQFSDGELLDVYETGKYTVFVLEFLNIQSNIDLITLSTISFDSKLPSDFKTKIEIIDFDWSTDCSNTLLKEAQLLSVCAIPIQTKILIRDRTVNASQFTVVPIELEIEDFSNVFIKYNNVVTLRYQTNQADLIEVTNGFILSKTEAGNFTECMIKLNEINIAANNTIISYLTFEFFDDLQEFGIDIVSIKWYEPCIESTLQGGTILRECELIEFKLSIPEDALTHNENVNSMPIYLQRISQSIEKRLINLTEFELVVSNNITVLSFDDLIIDNHTQDEFNNTYTLSRNPFEHDGNLVLIGKINYLFTEQSIGKIEISNTILETDDFCNIMILDNFESLFGCDSVKLFITMADTTVALGSNFSRTINLFLDKKIPHKDSLMIEFKIKSKNKNLKINSLENIETVNTFYDNGFTVFSVSKFIAQSHENNAIVINFTALLDDAESGSIEIFDIVSDYECLKIDDSMIGDIYFEEICQDDIRYIQLFKRTFVEAVPNPAFDSFEMTVKSVDDGLVTVQIFNLYNELVFYKQWTKSGEIEQLVETVDINTEIFSSGTYFINLQTTNTSFTKKLIIIK